MLLRPYLLVEISMVTLERMQVGMREFMVVKDSEYLKGEYLESERILEFAGAHNLVVSNSLFTKIESHMVTYQSGENYLHPAQETERQFRV